MADLLPYGRLAVLVVAPVGIAPAQVARAVRALALPGVLEIVPAARTVLVSFSDHASRAAAEAALAMVAPSPATDELAETVTVPTRYDGADLTAVAEATGLSPAEVVRRHTASSWRVAFVGFAPGFAYLAGGDPSLRVSRHASPRTAVPAGSVALADGYCGIYPRATPGGWQLIGTTDLPVWDLTRMPPALLHAGVEVRFVPVQA